MGFLDWLGKKNQERASRRVKKVSYDSAKTMLVSAMAHKLKHGPTSISELCKAAIYTRPRWQIGFESELIYNGNPTGFVINESISIADVIEHVVRQEWLADPFLPDMPDPMALVDLGAATAREYVLTKIDKF